MIQQEAPHTKEQLRKAKLDAISAIEKEHGKGSVFSMGDRVGIQIPSIPTGIYDVDFKVLGCGGFPRGRICEIFGPEMSGKTTIALTAIARAQEAGGQAAVIDAEHALSPDWAAMNGVNVDDLLVSQPDYGEQALSIAAALLESKAFDIILVDSVAALVPRAELEGDMGDSNVGLQARLMSQAMRKLTGLVAKSNSVLLFINQIREKIGISFGSPETTTGGRALKFFSSVRLDIRRIGQVKDGDKIIGNRTRVKAVKNKVAPPFRESEVDLLYDRGFDHVGNLVDVAVSLGVVEKSGSWFSWAGERLGQGRANAIDVIRDAGRYQELLEAVRKEQEVVG